jgi:hypothetical protein
MNVGMAFTECSNPSGRSNQITRDNPEKQDDENDASERDLVDAAEHDDAECRSSRRAGKLLAKSIKNFGDRVLRESMSESAKICIMAMKGWTRPRCSSAAQRVPKFGSRQTEVRSRPSETGHAAATHPCCDLNRIHSAIWGVR